MFINSNHLKMLPLLGHAHRNPFIWVLTFLAFFISAVFIIRSNAKDYMDNWQAQSTTLYVVVPFVSGSAQHKNDITSITTILDRTKHISLWHVIRPEELMDMSANNSFFTKLGALPSIIEVYLSEYDAAKNLKQSILELVPNASFLEQSQFGVEFQRSFITAYNLAKRFVYALIIIFLITLWKLSDVFFEEKHRERKLLKQLGAPKWYVSNLFGAYFIKMIFFAIIYGVLLVGFIFNIGKFAMPFVLQPLFACSIISLIKLFGVSFLVLLGSAVFAYGAIVNKNTN